MRSKQRKHKRFILGMVCFALTIPFLSFSQYLNQVNETPLQFKNTLAYNFESNYLTSINTMSDSNWVQNGWNIIQFKQYDNEFNVINETRFQDSMYVYLQGTTVDYFNGEYYFSGWRRELFSASDAQGFVAKFNDLGELVWLNTYFPSVEETKVVLLKIINGRIYITGTHRDISNSLQHPFLSELDANGNLLWTEVFDTFDNAAVTKLQSVSDGLLLSGRYATQGTTNQRVVLYKLDFEGNTQWQKTYGLTGSWLGNNFAPIELPNGQLLLYGGQSHPQTEQSGSWLLLTDNQGNVIKDTAYHFSQFTDYFHGYYSPPIIRENNFLILGYIRESGTSPRNAYLACIDFDFNIKWKRTFEERESQNRLTFIHDMGNDFYLLSGVVDNDANHPTTDEWFVVVDSMGCDVTDCYLGLEEQHTEAVSFSVYPNPTSDNFTIQLHGNDNTPTMHYKLMDLTGKIVQKGSLINNNVSVSGLYSGVYVVYVEEDGKPIGVRKVVVE